jgi:hypothetical protein
MNRSITMGRKVTKEPKVRIAHRDTRVWENIDTYTTYGFWHDGWMGEVGSVTVTPPADARWLRVVGSKHHNPDHLRIDSKVDDHMIRREILAVGDFIIDLPIKRGGTAVTAEFMARNTFVPVERGINSDARILSWVFVGVQVAK